MDTRTVLAASLTIACLLAAPAAAEPPPAPPGPAAATPEPAPAAPGTPPADPDPAAGGAVIGEIRVRPENIFDIADPAEDNWLFRLANRLHFRTRPWVVSRQLLFRPGDPYDPRLLAESERMLRAGGYFYDAKVRAGEVRDGRVDVDVQTRDVWTLQPGISFQRTGGKNTTGVDLREKNLFGLGSSLSIQSKSTPDRRTESVTFADDHLVGSRLKTSLLYSRNSDGHRRSGLLERPFYALDARWAAGLTFNDEERVDTLVGTTAVASRLRTEKKVYGVSGGWSRGLSGGWALRYVAGAARDETRFSVAPGDNALAAPLPADRVLAYPYAGIELVEDDYETAKNRNQIERTEDFYLGLRILASAGYAFPAFGSDRHAVPFSLYVGDGVRPGHRWTLTGETTANGRIDNGAVRDTTLAASGRVYFEWSDAWLSFASASGSRQFSPDADHQLDLGGDTGLRGYPMRYQAGDRKFLATFEQRYYTTWYLFRLVRLGAAAFFDVGRAWGGNVTGLPATGTLCDAGVGLRFALTRSGLGNVVHVDVAFPINGDPSIARTQVNVVTKSSF